MKTAISFKIDTDVRDRARSVAKKIGVPLSMVVNQQLKQFANDRSIEFYQPLIPNAKTRRVLDEAMRDIREGNTKAFSPAFDNAEDAIGWLHRR